MAQSLALVYQRAGLAGVEVGKEKCTIYQYKCEVSAGLRASISSDNNYYLTKRNYNKQDTAQITRIIRQYLLTL